MNNQRYVFFALLAISLFALGGCSFMDQGAALHQDIPTISECKECCKYIPEGEKTAKCQVVVKGIPTIYRCYIETDDNAIAQCRCLEAKQPVTETP